VSDFATLEEAFARIGQQEGRYPERGYLFVLAALEYAQGKLPARRHLSGAELAWACRDFALDQFGLLAPTVLAHWGITSTDDLGRIVFTLIDVGLLARQPSDKHKAWVCTNPDCGFNIRIDNGEISFGRAIGQSFK